MWQVNILRMVAKILKVQFKIGGISYGAKYEIAVNRKWERSNIERGADQVANS